MSNTGPTEPIGSVPELLAHAYRIEVDAEERYRLLADQMEVHNNPELASLFRDLASHEEKHAQEILRHAGEHGLTGIPEHAFDWGTSDSPEAADLDDAHYRMTPWHALQMALAAEQRAHDFFDQIVKTVTDTDVRKWAEEFREEEAEHVGLVERLLERHDPPPDGWDADDDPPNLQE